jgi:hypothetical protein
MKFDDDVFYHDKKTITKAKEIDTISIKSLGISVGVYRMGEDNHIRLISKTMSYRGEGTDTPLGYWELNKFNDESALERFYMRVIDENAPMVTRFNIDFLKEQRPRDYEFIKGFLYSCCHDGGCYNFHNFHNELLKLSSTTWDDRDVKSINKAIDNYIRLIKAYIGVISKGGYDSYNEHEKTLYKLLCLLGKGLFFFVEPVNNRYDFFNTLYETNEHAIDLGILSELSLLEPLAKIIMSSRLDFSVVKFLFDKDIDFPLYVNTEMSTSLFGELDGVMCLLAIQDEVVAWRQLNDRMKAKYEKIVDAETSALTQNALFKRK